MFAQYATFAENALFVARFLGNEFNSRLRVFGASSILQFMPPSRSLLALENRYKFLQGPSLIDGYDVCGSEGFLV